MAQPSTDLLFLQANTLQGVVLPPSLLCLPSAMYYLYYHTRHARQSVSIVLPVPPERQDKHLESPQPTSQQSPWACDQLRTMSEGSDAWLPMLFVP